MVRAYRLTLLLLALLSLGGGAFAADPPVNNRLVLFANQADTPARLTDLMASRQPYSTRKRSDTETLLVYVQKFPFVATPDEKVTFDKARARGEDPGPKTRVLVIGVLKAPNATNVLFRYWSADSHLLELYDATEYKGSGYLVCKISEGVFFFPFKIGSFLLFDDILRSELVEYWVDMAGMRQREALLTFTPTETTLVISHFIHTDREFIAFLEKWGQKLVNQVPRTGYVKPLKGLASPWVPDTETREVFRLNPEVKSHLRRDLPRR